MPSRADFAIVGAGAIGVAVARELTLLGQRCVVLEKEAHVLSGASSGNTGHLASNFYYRASSAAPLEHALTQRAVQLNRAWLRQQPNVPFKRRGMIFLGRGADDERTMSDLMDAAKQNSVAVRALTPGEVRAMEPNLCLDGVSAALYSAEEFAVDPWLLPMSNLYVALHHGCELLTSCNVSAASYRDGVWHLSTDAGREIEAQWVVNCGGNYSDDLHELMSGNRNFTVRPAKGEFVVFSKPQEPLINTFVVGMPSEATAGLYVFQSVYGHVLCGPTHSIQDLKEDRSCSAQTRDDLSAVASSLFPRVRDLRVSCSYSGLRPASEYKDYQIVVDKRRHLVTAGAIRSTGLTASRAIAEYIAWEIFGFDSLGKMQRKEDVVMPAAKRVEANADFVDIGGRLWRPMHPISRLGLLNDNTGAPIVSAS